MYFCHSVSCVGTRCSWIEVTDHELMAARAQPIHASAGGSRGYHPEHRADALAAAAVGQGHLMTPHSRSIARWAANGVGQRQQTGGRPAANLRGEHQFLLCLCRVLYPKVEADEIITFIAMHSENPVIYSRYAISKREAELGLTRKKASTTANQALEPANMLKRQLFWTTPLPTGLLGIPRQVLIDIDECGLWLEKGNRKHGTESRVGLCDASAREGGLLFTFLGVWLTHSCHYHVPGKAFEGVRVREPGPYGHAENGP